MYIDRLNSLRPSATLSRDDPTPRRASILQGLADALSEHLTQHAGSDRLKESLVRWSAEHGSAGGRSPFGWQPLQHDLDAPTQSPLNQVLTDILEEINGGTGQNLEVDIDDAYRDEDLLGDLAQMFAHRRTPIGGNDIGNQSDFGSANNPFCGALFGDWESYGPLDRRNASLRLLLRLVAVLGRRKLLTLLDIDDSAGQARYAPDDQDLLFEVASFMDQHPLRYPPPIDDDGQAWTWTDRIALGTPLQARETRLFQLALEQLDLALARLAGQYPATRRRARRSREEIEFHLSVTGSTRNVLRLMCA
ncbi:MULTISPECIES: type III secretion protein [unclassified Pseudomonas]|uniref:type III secretion protein n=1 Tax=unclassified Pseudomonas TaxID=196821 RepID=UPI0035C12AD7